MYILKLETTSASVKNICFRSNVNIDFRKNIKPLNSIVHIHALYILNNRFLLIMYRDSVHVAVCNS
jgi:hypothetical protein